MNRKESYEKRKFRYEKLSQKQKKYISFISTIRFIIFFVGIILSSFLYVKKYIYFSLSSFLAFLVLFIFAVMIHRKFKKNKSYADVLIEINENCIKRFTNQWKDFKDAGEEFKDDNHNYSSDLDIFGKGSLFQWINTASTYLGRNKLKETLSKCSKKVEEINKRQLAIKELSLKLKWRQRFEAEGKLIGEKVSNPVTLFQLAKDKKTFYTNIYLRLIIKLLPIITISTIIIYLVSHKLQRSVPLSLIALQIFLLIPKSKERFSTLDTIYEFKNSIVVYYKMIKLIEKKNFSCEYLKQLKNNIINNDKITASKQIASLVSLCEKVNQRGNSLYIVINILFLLDYQYMCNFECWKEKYGQNLEKWFNTVAEFEELCSLSIINYDHPYWVIPTITKESLIFKARAMAHPLIGEKGVSNDLTLQKPSTIGLITGSNMSGKSTLLRTSGINLVIAYTGAAVCARSFTCSIMNIYTCMRVSDNLEKNISSFYAELLKIKNIVKASKEQKEIFFLLDEIFKGTNSLDRHTGAKVLISSLGKEKTLGLVSTHDLELGDLEKESGSKVKNYHFREYYKNDEIYFDYKLQNGISKTRNALYLMKMAGIEVNVFSKE